jgi:hypothetical protein
VRANAFNIVACAGLALAALTSAGCGEYVRNSGRGAAQPVILLLQGASGAEPDRFGGTVRSDVITMVNRTVNGQQVATPTIFNDLGQVTMSLVLKDPGQTGLSSAPSALNQVTFTRYRVVYRRADGQNTPGIDVPYAFDSGATFTVPAEQSVTASFELVRHIAKDEAPLRALSANGIIITTIADVTFYGRDQAGNEISVTGSIGVDFGNFGDPS